MSRSGVNCGAYRLPVAGVFIIKHKSVPIYEKALRIFGGVLPELLANRSISESIRIPSAFSYGRFLR